MSVTTTSHRKPSPRGRKNDLAYDDGIEIGPAMRALIPRHREAVRQLFETRGNRVAALAACGYGNRANPHWRANLCFEASRFFSDRKIRAAIREECASRLEFIEPELIETVRGIASDEKEKAADRLRALSMLWDRARPVESTHRIEVEHHLSSDERDMEHYAALKKLGATHDVFVQRFGINGIERVRALVASEALRRKQLEDGEVNAAPAVIDVQAEEISDAR